MPDSLGAATCLDCGRPLTECVCFEDPTEPNDIAERFAADSPGECYCGNQLISRREQDEGQCCQCRQAEADPTQEQAQNSRIL